MKSLDFPTSIEVQKYSWGKLRTIHVGSKYSLPIHPESWNKILFSIRTGEMAYLEIETGIALRVHPQRDGFRLSDDYGHTGINVFVSSKEFDRLNENTFNHLIGEVE